MRMCAGTWPHVGDLFFASVRKTAAALGRLPFRGSCKKTFDDSFKLERYKSKADTLKDLDEVSATLRPLRSNVPSWPGQMGLTELPGM